MTRQAIHFIKMHGIGNDMMLIDLTEQAFVFDPAHISTWAHRRTGIGFDQLLLLSPPSQPDIDFDYRIFNADGSEVEQCGNGARCVARYLKEKGKIKGNHLRLGTVNRILDIAYETEGKITVNMRVPVFDPATLPFLAETAALTYTLSVKNQQWQFGAVSIGNPHIVIEVSDIDGFNIEDIGRSLSTHPAFPRQVNVGFMSIMDRTTINLRVYERGVGETLACGSGACAAMVIARRWHKVDDVAEIYLPGGQLSIRWQGEDSPVYMSGDAVSVFEGDF